MSRDWSFMMLWLFLQASNSPVRAEEWKAKVVNELNALIKSCVEIPCSFTHTGDVLSTSTLTGRWFLKEDETKAVYDEDNDQVTPNFRERTELMGRLREGNCTLKIMKVKEDDQGHFCFQVEDSQKKFTFEDQCPFLKTQADPPNPKLRSPKKAIQGEPHTLYCSVTHTCPSHRPQLTWSRSPADTGAIQIHKHNGFGTWEVGSILTFLPEEKDDHTEVSCTATFNGGLTSTSTLELFVKRKETYLHIILPLAVGIVAAVGFGVLYVLLKTKYKNRIADLQNRGNGRVWNHISRMSQRVRSRVSTQPRPRPNNTAPTTSTNYKISKPRCPSPKSPPASFCSRPASDGSQDHCGSYDDDYTNMADLNVYGNL